MNRRRLLKIVVALILSMPGIWSWLLGARSSAAATRRLSRVRPTDPEWPSEKSWDQLREKIQGKLVKVQSPLAECMEAPSSPNCVQIFKELKNPYYLGDEVGLTQSLGWVDAWMSRPSASAESTDDVVAAVNFARENNLRLVVKGGGHSYQGTSNAADSLLIWTRNMKAFTLHDAFVGSGCDLEAGLRRCHDQRGTLRSGWWMHNGWRCWLGPKRRFRKLLKGLWDGCCEPAGSPDRYCRWRSKDRQRLHESGPVLGNQGRWRREPWRCDTAHVADARSAGILRCGVHDYKGNIGECLPPADSQGHRILQRVAVQSALG